MGEIEPTSSAAPGALRIGYFTRSVVVHVARERGIFAAHGLDVVELPCPSSSAQFASLRAGDYDVVITSPDNVAAYRLSDANPLGTRLDVRMLLAIDAGLGLSVLSDPEVASLADLQGRRVGVDVASSGFAMALLAVLGRAGLRADSDFEVVELGSTPRRRDALFRGECDATLLYAGHDVIAETAGFRRLARVTDHLYPYLGAVLACGGQWLVTHRVQAQRVVDAWRTATDLILQPAERSYVEASVAGVMQLPAEAAAGMRSVLGSERDGLVRDGVVRVDALRTVLATRAKYSVAGGICGLTDEAIRTSGLIEEQLIDLDRPLQQAAGARWLGNGEVC